MKAITYGIFKNRTEMCVSVPLIRLRVAELNERGVNISIDDYIKIIEFTFHGEDKKHYNKNGEEIEAPKFNYDLYPDFYMIKYDKKSPHKRLPDNLFPIVK